jgi:hypothetical protein
MSAFSVTVSAPASTWTSPGREKSLGAALLVDAVQPGAQRCGPRGPDQPMAIVEHPQDPGQLARPSLGGVGAVLGGAERVIGDEHLGPARVQRAQEVVGSAAVVRLPAAAEAAEGDHCGRGRLAHLRRAGEDREAMAAEHG